MVTPREPDVIVVGAGIVGIACAEACSADGLQVLLLDRGPIASGTTAAGMGHIVVPGGPDAEFALARYSQQLWQRLSPELPREAGVMACGTLWLAEDESHLNALTTLERSFGAHRVPAEPIPKPRLCELEPRLSRSVAGGLLVPEDLVLDPVTAARAVWERARARGAEFRTDASVLAVRGGEVQLEDATRLRAPHVVIAAGVDSPSLARGLPIRPRKGHLVAVEAPAGYVHHQLVEVGDLADARSDAEGSISFNVQPQSHGGVLVGSSRQYGSETTEAQPSVVRRMMARAESLLPGIGGLRVQRTWAGLRPASADHQPFIGPLPGDRQTIVAAGHEGLGITQSLGTGRLVADIVTGRRSEIARDPYSLDGRNLHLTHRDG